MDKEAVRNLEIESLTTDEARKIGMEFLEDSIDETKLTAKRFGFASAVLTAGTIIGTITTNSPIMYGLMGLDAFAINITTRKLFQLAAERKVLKKMKNNTFEGDYIQFAKDCKDYVEKYYPEENQKTM